MRLDELRGRVIVALHRPEGYEDVHPELLLEDARVPATFQPEVVDLSALIDAAEAGRRMLAPWGDCDTAAEAQLRAALSALEKQEQR